MIYGGDRINSLKFAQLEAKFGDNLLFTSTWKKWKKVIL